FFFSSRRRHTRSKRDWSSDVCSSDLEEIPFEPRLTNAVFDPAAHPETLDNIRLWDWRALQATLRQIQEIRTYYDFPDIDVDRYRSEERRVGKECRSSWWVCY